MVFFKIEPEPLHTCCMSPCRNHYELLACFFCRKIWCPGGHIYKIIPADQTPGDLRRKPETKTQSSKFRFLTGSRDSAIGNRNQTFQTPLLVYGQISETVCMASSVSFGRLHFICIFGNTYTVLVVLGHIKHR